ncbi:MAG TPA: 50S ribosomal protein L11 methyltransferase [Chitinophagaceae bacterium]|nr:50S ribosomal protein L11 methyltransferase [Chitinophagaceae bacterium]
MKPYIQIQFQNISTEQSELLVAELSNIGFEGFEEEENSLKAFIAVNAFDELAVNEISELYDIPFTKLIIEETNWNAVWESNFQPVIVDDFVAIRADFHEPIEGVKHEIIITPKMSFGTGHHATTMMMIRQMREIDFANKTVFDFGTGTGILAILAEKLGAKNIIAVDNDEWSIANAEENINRNNCKHIQLMKADSVVMGEQYDIILANINKNVLVDNLPALAGQFSASGALLLSGLLAADEADMLTVTEKFSLILRGKSTQDSWICLKFTH